MVRRSVLALAVVAVAYIIYSWLRLPPDVIRGPAKVVASSGGACAIWEGGSIRCWGRNPYSAYDDVLSLWKSDERPWPRPSPRAPVQDVVFASYQRPWDLAGGCALTLDGTLECTGQSLGTPLEPRIVPALRTPPTLRRIRSPVLSDTRVCVIGREDHDESDSVWCVERANSRWGRMALLGEPRAIAMGWRELCAVQSSGGVRCLDWLLGEARDIRGIEAATQIAVAEDFACARDLHGVLCWGNNSVGQLGDGTTFSRFDEARPIALVAPTSELAVYGRRACVLREGVPWCWGLLRPERSLPAIVARMPEPAAEISGLRTLTVSAWFACGTRAHDATVWCWGNDTGGKLGNGASLPHLGCGREGISGSSPEQEELRGPTPVRTGDAGAYPRARGPLALILALLVVAPLSVVRSAWTRGGSYRAFRVFAALLWALFVPMFVTRFANAALAFHGGVCGGWGCSWSWFGAETPIKAAVPLLVAFAATTSTFTQLGTTTELPKAALRSRLMIGVVAVPTLLCSMYFTTSINANNPTELAYLLRDAALQNVYLPFLVQYWWTVGWIVLAIIFALFGDARATPRSAAVGGSVGDVAGPERP